VLVVACLLPGCRSPETVGSAEAADPTVTRLKPRSGGILLEWEALLPPADTSGERLRPVGTRKRGGGWSGEAELEFEAAGPGSFVAFDLPIPEAREYDLAAQFSRGPEYGRVQVSVDGRPLGAVFDGWAAAPAPSGRVPLGRVRLERGDHEIRFEVVGKNDAAAGYHVGLDALVLE